MTKYRNPRITPNPLFVVDGLPPHIDLIKHDDCIILRCGKCGTSARHGLPVTPAWLRRIAHAFKDRHGHDDANEQRRQAVAKLIDEAERVLLMLEDEGQRLPHLARAIEAAKAVNDENL